MTKEERARKWFCDIANAKDVSMEAKMQICAKVSRKMLVTFVAISIAECAVIFLTNDGAIFTWLADIINNFSDENQTKNHYAELALLGSILLLPPIVIALAVVVSLKNRWLKAELSKVIKEKE